MLGFSIINTSCTKFDMYNWVIDLSDTHIHLYAKSLSVSYKGFSDQVAATGVTSTSMSQALTDGKL